MSPLNLLILGGTGEASELARCLAKDHRFAPVLSLAGRTRAPRLPPIPHRIGGFGGIEGLVRFLSETATDLLVCATHPYAAQMRRHAAAAARRAGLPLLLLDRPAWVPQGGDRWTVVADMAAAATALGQDFRRVLLTTGQRDLAPFRARPQHHYVIRTIEPPSPDILPPDVELIIARGPFAESEERALLRSRRIDILVTKNSGGKATEAKLVAAGALNLPVVMVDRPALPDGRFDTVSDAGAALAWLDARHRMASSRLGV